MIGLKGKWHYLCSFVMMCFNEDMMDIYPASSSRDSAWIAVNDFFATQPLDQVIQVRAELAELLIEAQNEAHLEKLLDELGNSWDFAPYRRFLESILAQIDDFLRPTQSYTQCGPQRPVNPSGSTSSPSTQAAHQSTAGLNEKKANKKNDSEGWPFRRPLLFVAGLALFAFFAVNVMTHLTSGTKQLASNAEHRDISSSTQLTYTLAVDLNSLLSPVRGCSQHVPDGTLCSTVITSGGFHNSDNVVVDKRNHLMWLLFIRNEGVGYAGNTYFEDTFGTLVEAANEKRFLLYSDWRLPTENDVRSLFSHWNRVHANAQLGIEHDLGIAAYFWPTSDKCDSAGVSGFWAIDADNQRRYCCDWSTGSNGSHYMLDHILVRSF